MDIPISMHAEDLVFENGELRFANRDAPRAKLLKITERLGPSDGPFSMLSIPAAVEPADELDLPAFRIIAGAYLDSRLAPDMYRNEDQFIAVNCNPGITHFATASLSGLAGQLGYAPGSGEDEASFVARKINGFSDFLCDMAGTRHRLLGLVHGAPGEDAVSFSSNVLDAMIAAVVKETCGPEPCSMH